jgi:cytochrome P450
VTAVTSFAGSDTTAISLRAMFYYLCKNRLAYSKLLAEIDSKDQRRELSDPVTFAESNQMPYLQVCMKEAMRLHPSCGQLLERVVPQGGATMCAMYLPQNTIVGINPWVVARDRTVYGSDANNFRPERWLEASPAELKLMERNFLAVRLFIAISSKLC